MAQHFLLSRAARDLDIGEIHRMTEEESIARYRLLCWPDTHGEPVCPYCSRRDPYVLATPNKWKCRGCKRQFTPTSGTVFKSHKLSYRQILVTAALFVNGVNGVAACRMAREIKVAYKSAFVLLHKLREAMGADDAAAMLGGVVEMDGAVFGRDHNRMPNDVLEGKKFFKNYEQAAKKKKRLIVVIRERVGEDPGVPDKVRTFLLQKEGDAVEIARKIVMPDTIVHADFGTGWEPLHAYFNTKRINHSLHYSHDGACTNQAESFFSRMRTAERGVHKHISGAHLHRYAMELGWREQFRRKSNGFQFAQLINAGSRLPPSTTFKGYWRKRPSNNNAKPPANDDGDFFAKFA